MLPDFERADRIGEFWGYPESRAFAGTCGYSSAASRSAEGAAEVNGKLYVGPLKTRESRRW